MKFGPFRTLILAAIGVMTFSTAAFAADPSCSDERKLKSVNSGAPAVLTFVNKNAPNDSDLTIYWINFQGKRIKYKTLAGGQNWLVKTVVGYPWLIAQPNWELSMLCKQIIMPQAPLRPVVIGGYPSDD